MGHVDVSGQVEVVALLAGGGVVLVVILRWEARPDLAPGEVVRRREPRHSTHHGGGVCPVIDRPIRPHTHFGRLRELVGGK